VWNAHNTVFDSKRSAICAPAIYFLHSTMPIVLCQRLSDVSFICHVILFTVSNSGLLFFHVGHAGGTAALSKIWGGFLYGAYSPANDFELIPLVTMATRHSIEG